jgi:hypothetical protein
MLEAGLNYDSRLDPYVIWYNGKNIISEGRLKDGAGNILRKMPEQAEFYSVRLEVLPFALKPAFTGYSREITLTVSPKAVNTGYFFTDGPRFAAHHSLAELNISAAAPVPPDLLHLYQFGGSMHDSVSALQTESDLTPVFDKPPQWVTVGQSFGLSTGPADSYFLPTFSFFRENPIRETPEQGGGIFLLHVNPAEGVIFNAFFPFRASPSEGVTMEMTATENSVVLRLSTPGENDTLLYLYPAPSARRSYIPVAVEFFFRPYRMEARISLSDPSLQSVTGSLKLINNVAGEGIIRLGGGSGASGVVVPARPASPETEKNPTSEIPDEISTENLLSEITREVSQTEETEPAAAADTATPQRGPTGPSFPSATPESPAEAEKKVPSVTVWNEFAVLYSRSPLLPEENIITAESENTEEQRPVRYPDGVEAVTRTIPQTEPKEIPIAAEDESDSEISAPSEEEIRILADYQEDTDEPESPGESGEDEEDTEDHSVAVSKDL